MSTIEIGATRYADSPDGVVDLFTGATVGAGSAAECNDHWARQITAHGTPERAFAAFEATTR